jgi:Uri superfamily endonuclease
VFRLLGLSDGSKIKRKLNSELRSREEFRNTEKLHVVYGIYISGVGRVYVGSTTQGLAKRKKQHIELLKNSSHYNVKLQRLFLDYGEDAFEFRRISSVRNRIDLRVQEGKIGRRPILIHPSDIKRK